MTTEVSPKKLATPSRTWIGLLALILALCTSACDDSGGTGNTGDGSSSGDDTNTEDGTTTTTEDTGEEQDSTSTGDTEDGDGTTTEEDTGGEGDTTAEDTADAGDTATPTVTEVRVDPDGQTLTVPLGDTTQTLTFTLNGVFSDGAERVVVADAWSTTPVVVGAINESGLFTASGTSGGIVTITGERQGLTDTATLTILLESQEFVGGLDPSTADLFPPTLAADPSPGSTPTLIYPQDGTVFPAGIIPPEIQWLDGGYDTFLLTLTRGQTTLRIHTTADRHKLSPEAWRALSDSASASDVTVTVYGRNGTDTADLPAASPSHHFDIVNTSLAGSVYYSTTGLDSESNGDEGVWRLPEGSESPTKLLSTAEEGACHGCHALSRDGSHIAYAYAENGRSAGIADLSPLATGGEATSERYEGAPISAHWFAFNPDGTRILVATDEASLHLYDYDPGTNAMNEVVEIAPSNAIEPTWSPDGGLIAYVNTLTVDGDANINTLTTDLVTRTVTTDTNAPGGLAFSDTTTLVTSDGLANAYPSFSPDSRYLAYSRGTFGRIKKFNSNEIFTQSLFLIDPVTPDATPIALERANLAIGTSALPYDTNPSFSPFIGGGYYWLLFRSLRPYGHYTAFDDVNHAYRHQLWVTAISIEELQNGTVDPSRPAFWLPGQAIENNNMTAYWAPNPCHADGDACTTSSDCCGGLVCNASGLCEPPTTACVQQGNTCADNAECCNGLQCLTNSAGEQTCIRLFN